jgi:uncharacterized protein (DUF1810 family)
MESKPNCNASDEPNSRDEFAHFIEAQSGIYNQVLSELSQGKKRSHWIWFIFPQIDGLGFSTMARRFALDSLEQATRYANHRLLGQRLHECTQLVLNIEGRNILDILGSPDDLKFRSCMTLFALAKPEKSLFRSALEKYYGGAQDPKTLRILGL